MLSLYDMMMQAQNGQAVEAMAKQFGLAQEQAAKAVAALMPAFSEGFKRNAATPYDLAAFMTAMASGDHAKYFEDMGKAFTPQGLAEGNGILGHIFGGKEVSRAVAAQAEQMTGIGQEILKQMLPAIASALMGGLFKQSLGAASNPFSDMVRQWSEATGLTRRQEPPSPFDNPFTRAAQDFFGTAPKEAEAANPFAANPFAKMFQDMFAGAAPAAKQEGTAADALKTLVNTMFDTGLDMQKDYQRNIETVFETMRNGMDGGSADKA